MSRDTTAPEPGNREFSAVCQCGNEMRWAEGHAVSNEYQAKLRGRKIVSTILCSDCHYPVKGTMREPLP